MKKQKIGMWALVAALALSAILNGVLLANNFANSSDAICEEDDVTKINQLAKTKDSNIEDAKKFKQEIVGRSGYDSNATCVQIIFTVDSWVNDLESIKSSHKKIVELNKQGKRPDLRIEGLQSLDMTDQYIENIDVEADENGRG